MLDSVFTEYSGLPQNAVEKYLFKKKEKRVKGKSITTPIILSYEVEKY